MTLLIFLRIIMIVCFSAFVITQVILPLIFQQKLFPLFRSSTNVIEDEIRETKSQIEEKILKAKLADLQAQLNSTNSINK